MISEFEKVFVVGSGKLTFQCAKYVKNLFPQVAVYEYKDSDISVLRELCNANEIEYQIYDEIQMGEKLLAWSSKRILIISALNTYLFRPELVDRDNITIINYHNAYLPHHRGRHAEAWCIYAGDRESGVTWHFVGKKVDAGAIIMQEKIQLKKDVTAIKLLQIQTSLAYELFTKFIGELINGKLVVSQHSEFNKEKAHLKKDVPNNGWLNLEWDMDQMYRFLRAMDYGKLKMLGTPKVKLGDTTFKIMKYHMIINQNMNVCDEEYRDGNTFVICRSQRKLELKLEV